MDQKEPRDTQHQIFTIPNIMSFFRLLLIPVFVWCYVFRKDMTWSLIILIVSGITDLFDGLIARRFHMISDLGKMLDPVADKLTAAALLICLIVKYPVMWVAFGALVIKEFSDGILGLMVIKRTGRVYGSSWHGKVTTVVMYVVVGLLILWVDIPDKLATALILLCAGLQLLSCALYAKQNLSHLHEPAEPEK
ncbi:MAG: CDP-alcohol phosphatidyltransferase family protein [Lachnospiraceae bacterium]|nr:CDP-alcohol phosphatidyltransferase family protein [Lachnospiraceae bacterium]